MQNIDIRFNATSNFGAVQAEMAAMQAQAKALRTTFATKGLADPGTVNPQRWREATHAIERASSAYRDAASSSGLLNTQQVRANSEVKRYTELMQKQKLGVRDMTKNWNIMKEAYRDQLRMQRMTAQQWGTDQMGRQVVDVTMPKNVPVELDNWRNKIGFVSAGLKSAGHEMINFGKNTQWAGRQLMVGFTMPVAVFGAVAGTLAYQVDKEMVRIQKVYDVSTDSMIDKEQELNRLRTDSMNLAKQVANEYGIAARETLAVQAELAATGLTGGTLLESTKGVMRISTLGELDFQKSVDMTVALQTAFRKTIKDGDDLNETFDYMNALENATSLSLQDMTEAIPRAAAGFAQLGGTVRELGVLMTAMKESGIDPATGANALKSASTRIINPVAKALDFYSEQGIDLEKIRDRSGGNLFEYLKILGQQQQKIQGPTEKATNLLRAQGVAMLFGTYQNNRLTAALTNTADAYGGVENQAYRALEVSKLTRKELAALAEGEIATKMASASGRFEKALESIKIELAEMGEPFLEAATDIMGVLEKIVKGFNALPDGVKKFMMWGAIITAVIGPLIMLTGLFFNLAGHLTVGLGLVGLFATKFKFLTMNQRMAKIVTDELNNSLARQSPVVSTLALELQALSMAYERATLAAQNHFASSSAGQAAAAAAAQNRIGTQMVGLGGKMPPTPGIAGQGSATPTRAQIGALLGQPYHGPANRPTTTLAGVTSRYDKNGREYFRTTEGKQANKAQIAGYRQVQALQSKIQTSEKQTLITRNASANVTAKTADNVEDTKKGLNSGQRAAGAMQLALVGSMVTSGKLQNTLIGATTALFAFSAAQQLGLTAAIGKGWTKATGNMTTFKTNGGRTLAAMTTGAKVFGRALLGPIGLAIAALGTLGYLAWKKMREPQEQQEAINRSVQTWADTLGVVEKKYNAIDMSINQYADQTVSTQELAAKLVETDDGKKIVDSLKSARESGDEGEVSLMGGQEYIKLLTQTNATAEDAQRAIEAMYMAAGMGFIEAGQRAAEMRDIIGDTVDAADMTQLWSVQMQEALQSVDSTLDERSQGIADMLYKSLEQAGSEAQMDDILVNFSTTFDNMSAETWKNAIGDELNGALQPFGEDADAGEVLRRLQSELDAAMAVNDATPGGYAKSIEQATTAVAGFYGVSRDEVMKLHSDYNNLDGDRREAIENISNAEKQIIDRVRSQLNIKEKVHSMNELLATDEWQIYTTTKDNVRMRVQGLKEELRLRRQQVPIGPLTGSNGGEQGTLEQINLRLRKVGMQEIADINDKINWKVLEQKERQKDVNREIDNGKNKLSAALRVWNQFKNGGWADAQKTAFSSVTGSVADQISSSFDATQAAAMSGLDRVHSAQDSRLQASHDAASRALDNRLSAQDASFDRRADGQAAHFDKLAEKAQKYFDNRIEGVNKVIEAEEKADATRQKIFDREMTRLTRLTEAQNRNIDFNMAINQGEFDEAAKIQNDAAASETTNAYEDADAKADAASERRRERLEKQIERLEKRRDTRLKQIENAREAAAKALEIQRNAAQKSAEIERARLQKQQEMQSAAMERRQEKQKAALAAEQAAEKARFEQQLALLRNYIPTSEKDLRQHMARLAGEYNEFGQAYANTSIGWGKFIKDQMTMQMKAAAVNLKSEVNWAGAGHDAGAGMISGMANAMGMSAAKFRQWIGIEAAGNRPKPPGGSGNSGSSGQRRNEGDSKFGPQDPSSHNGGLLGGSRQYKRTGYTGSQSKHSEMTINAKRGEYMVNDKAVRRFGVDNLDAINDGRFGVGGAGDGFMMGAAAKMMGKSIINALRNRVQDKVDKRVRKQERRAARSYGTAGAGTYGDSSFSAEQLRNASAIASVGKSLGASTRDIQIALMTAMQESTLKNLDYGHLDSVGLFQQRDAWGSFADRTNPKKSARMFFLGGQAGQRGLFDFPDRGNMSLAQAAQAVQVSAYPDAYAKWANEAAAILRAMKKGGGGGVSAGYVPGTGKRTRPVAGGSAGALHYNNGVDIGVPVGTPLRAVANGTVTASYDIPGYEPRAPHGGLGYKSYGRVIKIDHGGFSTLSAHLSRRSVSAGQRVAGGSIIGATGNTGYSTGPHLHFEAHGASPYAFLKKGGTIKYDNTPAILHRDERVLSAPLTAKLDQGLSNLNNGPMHVTIDLRGSTIKEDIDIKKAVYAAIDERNGRVGRKRVVG